MTTMLHNLVLAQAHIKRCLFIAVVMAGSFALSGCGPNYLYQETTVLPSNGWTYADTVNYDFVIEDTLQIYNLFLQLNHSTGYPYQNLYIRLHTTFPDGQRLSETVSLELAGKAGNWLGKCSAEECQLEIPIQQGAYFNQVGNYQLTIAQHMRQDSLPGVQALTFAVEKTDQRR